jgi:hypothetical protein
MTGEIVGFIINSGLRRLNQKINRQVSFFLSVIEPPTSGPTADPMFHMPNTIGDSIACFFRDTQYDRLLVVPLIRPAAPRPDTARPMIWGDGRDDGAEFEDGKRDGVHPLDVIERIQATTGWQ